MLCANFGFGALGGAAMNIVGISAFYHDSAAALVRDGEIIAAAQEERFSRVRHDAGFPAHAVEYCLSAGGITVKDVDYFVFYDKPFLKFERLLETYLAYAPRGFRSFAKAMPVWSGEKLFQREILRRALSRNMPAVDLDQKLIFTEHHQSHAASAFYPSPFERAAVLTMDGVGEWTTTSVGLGEGKSLDIHREIHFPHSLGLLYSAFTYYLGFKVNSGEYKVMGLAPYGEPKYAQLLRDHLIDIRDDGSFHLDLSYFDYCTDLRMTNEKFDALMGGPRRAAGRVADTAPHGYCGLDPGGDGRGGDAARGARGRKLPGARSLSRRRRRAQLRGERKAAALGLRSIGSGFSRRLAMPAVRWGRRLPPIIFISIVRAGPATAWTPCWEPFSVPNSARPRSRRGCAPPVPATRCSTRPRFINATVDALVDQNAVGWFQGRMEFGPRALGARSILADPRATDMQKRLNVKTKYRESFRPFAPGSMLRGRGPLVRPA